MTGSLELRYDFVGNFQKAAPSADQTATLTANITAGQRFARTSASVTHLLAPGAVIRVGDQEMTVEKVSSDGRTVTFTPYSVHGAVNLDIYVMETLVAAATPTSVTTFTMSTDVSMEIFPGDMVRLTRSNNNAPDIITSKLCTVASVSATQIVITASTNLLGSATKVLVYKQKTKLVPADAAADELDTAISLVS